MKLLLKNVIEKHDMAEETALRMCSFFQLKELQKGDYLLRYNQVCRHIGFIEQGSVVYLTHTGKDETVCDFALEGQWVTYVKSLMSGTPAELSIRATEPLQIALIDTDGIQQLAASVPEAAQVQAQLMRDGMVEMAQRSVDLVSLTAEDRYLLLVKSQPQLFQRFPLGYIADYLGITQRHLTRLRSKQ
jgi:CRP-like cAMP-binding protein